MFSAFLKEKCYCGLDIGSSRIKVCLLKGNASGRLEVLGINDIRTLGFNRGAVTELEDLTECVQTVIRELEVKAGYKIHQVYMGVDDELIEARRVTTVIPLVDRGSKVVTSMDVRKIRGQVRLLGVGIDEELIHEIPQSYQIDDTSAVINPIGLYAHKLGISSLMIVSNGNRLRNMIKAVNQAGCDVGGVCLGNYVSSDIVLSRQDRKLGCILVDIGASGTDIMIFKDGVLKEWCKLPVGGDDFTMSIARRFDLSFDLAEQLKKSYATAFGVDRHNDEEILVKKEGRYTSVKREGLHLSIEEKISPLLEGISGVLSKAREENQIAGGIIMTGGGSLLSGLIERIAEETAESVNLGKVNVTSNQLLPDAIIFSSAFGLANYASKQSFSLTSFSAQGVGFIKGAVNRIKELYLEYF